jgi:hypothetical protein
MLADFDETMRRTRFVAKSSAQTLGRRK